MQRPIVEASSRLSVEASSEEESDKLRKGTMLFQLIDRRRRIRQHIGTIVVENKPSLVSLSRTGNKIKMMEQEEKEYLKSLKKPILNVLRFMEVGDVEAWPMRRVDSVRNTIHKLLRQMEKEGKILSFTTKWAGNEIVVERVK